MSNIRGRSESARFPANGPVSGIELSTGSYVSVADRRALARNRAGSQTRLSRRLMVVQAVLLGFVLLIVGQLVRWQIIERKDWLLAAPTGQIYQEEVPSQRGLILDRNQGLLAFNSYDYTVFAAPNQISEEETAEVAQRLAPIIGWPADQLVERLSGDGLYAQIERQIPRQAGKAILDLQSEGKLPGIHVRPLAVRVYPEHVLAAHTLGFVAGDAQEGTKGYYGIEGFYDKTLKGRSGLRQGGWDPWLAFDPQRAVSLVAGGTRGWRVPQEGRTLVLTLDKTLQYLIEQELRDAVERYGAEGGCVVVLNPKTGALLALASYPTYDPNQFAQVEEKRFIDPIIGRHYEPGSTFKVITMAAALEAGAVHLTDVYNDVGYIEVGGRTFQNWDKEGYGIVTMTDIMVHSLNTGIAHVSTLLGADRFYHYVERFGFGRKLGVDLEGEADGAVRRQGDPEWHESDLGTHAFGQGLAVTPLQMAVAVGAIANHGFMMRPYVVSQMIDADATSSGPIPVGLVPGGASGRLPTAANQETTGRAAAGVPFGGTAAEDAGSNVYGSPVRVVEVKQVAVRQVIGENTARLVTEMMVEAVERGAPLARVEGYRIAGKTGTAQTPVIGGYDPSLTIASFVGFAPADDPQFLILVKLDKPTTSPWGTMTAAPTFANIARIMFTQLAIPPQAQPSVAGAQ
jgi:cell division protein FtsI/penicillin-binding protein 2